MIPKKKREYGGVCRARRLHLTPFAVTTSGILAPEAKALLKKFARVLGLADNLTSGSNHCQ